VGFAAISEGGGIARPIGLGIQHRIQYFLDGSANHLAQMITDPALIDLDDLGDAGLVLLLHNSPFQKPERSRRSLQRAEQALSNRGTCPRTRMWPVAVPGGGVRGQGRCLNLPARRIFLLGAEIARHRRRARSWHGVHRALGPWVHVERVDGITGRMGETVTPRPLDRPLRRLAVISERVAHPG
jgi:hypothetical protein